MAGIGFTLRKLVSRDDLLGLVQAYVHSAIVGVGTWMLIAATLGILSFFTRGDEVGTLDEFQSIIMYNLLFSFIISAPVYMIAARYVSDCLFDRDATPVPGIMLTSQFQLAIPAVILSAVFYIFVAKMDALLTVLSIINFVLFSDVWYTMLYLSSIRNFRAITISWILGTLLAAGLGVILGDAYKVHGLLIGLNIGLAVLLFSLKAQILAEYPYRFIKPKQFKFYYRNYRYLFWTGFFLFASMWVDKLMMWGTEHATHHLNNLVTYPTYDNAMLRAYLSVIPAMAFFLFSVETNFYESYIRYVKNIEADSPYSVLESNRGEMITKIAENGRNVVILQGSVTLIVLAIAPTLFTWFKIDFLQLSIFRFGTLGAFFNVMNLFIVIFFSYFDSQESMFKITACMFFGNAFLTLLTIPLGFGYYGLGYCLAMTLTFLYASLLFYRFLNKLHFHVFVTNAIKRKRLKLSSS